MRIFTHQIPSALVVVLVGSAGLVVGGRVQVTAVVDRSAHETWPTECARLSILEGAANFRDIGGYAASDGRHVRRGLIYRSSQLSELTANDYVQLHALGITLVCDFRTDGERRRSPTRWQGQASPAMMHAPILEDADIVMSPERLRALASRDSAETLGASYERMVTEDAAREYGRLLKRIAGGDVPLVAHCTTGKDRTGMFSAILLTLLGVPRSAVIEDYMLTGEYILTPQALTKAAADVQRATGAAQPPSLQTLRDAYAMHADVLTRTFDSIDRHYGSFDDFVTTGLLLTPSEVTGVRTQLLE